MTSDQRDEALQAVHLLTLPCQNVCDIAYTLVHNIMCGAMRPEQSQLTIAPKVVTGLATLQSAVSDLSRAYIAHTDTVIGRGNASSLEQLNISNPLSGENGLFGGRGPTPAPTTEAPTEGKKRKRAPHDKNAPKRALTPFFLYLQTARPAIANEMGSGHTAKEVQDEGGRRWREMTDKDKGVGMIVNWDSRVDWADFLQRNGNIDMRSTLLATGHRQRRTKQENQFQTSVTPKQKGFTRIQTRMERSLHRPTSILATLTRKMTVTHLLRLRKTLQSQSKLLLRNERRPLRIRRKRSHHRRNRPRQRHLSQQLQSKPHSLLRRLRPRRRKRVRRRRRREAPET